MTIAALGVMIVLSPAERDADQIDDYHWLFWRRPALGTGSCGDCRRRRRLTDARRSMGDQQAAVSWLGRDRSSMVTVLLQRLVRADRIGRVHGAPPRQRIEKQVGVR